MGAGAGGPRPSRPLRIDGLHLAALSALAIAQPMFSALASQREFLVEANFSALELVGLALAVTCVPPALLLLVEALAGLISSGARRVVHGIFVFGLIALLASEVLREGGVGGGMLLAGTIATASAFVTAYLLTSYVRSVLTVLSAAALIFLVLFLVTPPVSKIVLPGADLAIADQGNARAPVVVVVFDEFPPMSLFDRKRRINAARYPSFARLARNSTSFPNATTVHGDTSLAVPAILTGRRAAKNSIPNTADHPNSLFGLLARSHELISSEPFTDLCPRSRCTRMGKTSFSGRMEILWEIAVAKYLPRGLVIRLPASFQPPETRHSPPREFKHVVQSIRRGSQPRLHFAHVLLPHTPLRYLPSGKSYSDASFVAGGAPATLLDPWLTTQEHQRRLLQVGYVDRLLGRLLQRLRRMGLYRHSLIAVLADHGVGLRPGGDRRVLTRHNIDELLTVPLLIKAPGQTRGRISRRYVRTTDVLPTIADLLDIRLPWKTEGESAFARARRAPRTLDVSTRDGGKLRLSVRAFQRRSDATLRRTLARFETRKGQLLRIGPHRDLIGMPLRQLEVGKPLPAEVIVFQTRELSSVELSDETIPARISGLIREGDPRKHDLAIALNGRIAATTRTYGGRGRTEFSALLPEAGLRQGTNEVRVFAVRGAGRRRVLVPLSR